MGNTNEGWMDADMSKNEGDPQIGGMGASLLYFFVRSVSLFID
jgi:hypothetical protein